MGPGVADAEDDAGGPDGAGLVLGAGLVADVQAATRTPTTIVVASRESEDPIRYPPDPV